jgi:hypothetical protein
LEKKSDNPPKVVKLMDLRFPIKYENVVVFGDCRKSVSGDSVAVGVGLCVG